MNEKFGKNYKLCSKRLIQDLFENGRDIKKYPLRLRYLKTNLSTENNFQITFSVPKKRFKKAPDRNRVKRLLREAVRKNKVQIEQFLADNNLNLALFLIYNDNEILSYKVLESKIVSIFERLINEIQKELNEANK